MFVQPGVNSDIVCSHLFDGELLDFFHGTRSTIFETNSMKPFVKVDGVFASDNVTHCGTLFFLRHFEILKNTKVINLCMYSKHDV